MLQCGICGGERLFLTLLSLTIPQITAQPKGRGRNGVASDIPKNWDFRQGRLTRRSFAARVCGLFFVFAEPLRLQLQDSQT